MRRPQNSKKNFHSLVSKQVRFFSNFCCFFRKSGLYQTLAFKPFELEFQNSRCQFNEFASLQKDRQTDTHSEGRRDGQTAPLKQQFRCSMYYILPKPGRIYFCIRRILSTNQCLILYTYLGVKSRKKFVYMKGQHNVEFCIHMSSRCNHLYTHFDLNLGH